MFLMALFLGNLSSRIRREELERVFRRFGRSDIQLKDGYGFVIYDTATNAERALRALQGENICGEQISITWAHRQPGTFRRYMRTTRFSQPYRGRNFKREEDDGLRSRGFQDGVEMTTDAKHLGNNHEGQKEVDLLNKETCFDIEDIDNRGKKGQNSKEGVVDEPKPLENDRWGEPNGDSLNDLGLENGMEFDRYEPYRGYDKRAENEKHKKNSSYGSPANASSPERARKERSGDATWKYTENVKTQHACYICGLIGHIRRNCPRAEALRREKFSRFDRWRDYEINFKGRCERGLKRSGPTSWVRSNLNKDRLVSRTRRRVSGRKASGLGKPSRLDERNTSKSLSSAKNHRSRLRKEFRVNERSKKEPEDPKKHQKKKARKSGLVTSVSKSISSSSWSLSTSSKSLSRSRSISSRSRSFSSTSRSDSLSSYSKSWSSRSRSRSTSSRSSSLAIPLVQQLPDTFTKNASEHVTNPISEYPLQEQGQLVVDVNSERLDINEKIPKPEDENNLFSCQIDDGENRVDLRLGNGDDNHATCDIEYEEKSLCAAPSEKGDFTDLSSNLQKSDTAVMELEGASVSNPNMAIPVCCHGNNSLSISSVEMLTALKHYGLPMPEESELSSSVDTYFGAARMWPWEMIYYRRLKKGPISTENYAKRLAQNREFGIIDKYVRSSSGWGEYDHSEV